MHRFFRLLAALTLATPIVGSAQSGTVTGRVTDRARGTPVAEATVIVVGIERGARTDDNGQYRIVNVPAGSQRVRALRLGYEAVVDTVDVPPGGTVTVGFSKLTFPVGLYLISER